MPTAPPPLGHSKSAHHVHGWCSHCPDRTPADELVAWRGWAYKLLSADLEPGDPDADRAATPLR